MIVDMGQIVSKGGSSATALQEREQTCETKSKEEQLQICCNDLDLFKNTMDSTGFTWSFYESREQYEADQKICPGPRGFTGPGGWQPPLVIPDVIHVHVSLERFSESVKETRLSTSTEKQKTEDRLSKQKERVENLLKLLSTMTHSYAPDNPSYQRKIEIVRPIPEKMSLMEEIDRKNAQKRQEYDGVLLEYKKIKKQLFGLVYGTKGHEEENEEKDEEEEEGNEDERSRFSEEDDELCRGPFKESYPKLCFETITICSFPYYIDFLCRKGTPEFDFLVSNNRISRKNQDILVWDGKPI